MNIQGSHAQQRRHARVEIALPVTLIVPGLELVVPARSLDLGGGGMRVSTRADLPAGQHVVLRFSLPGNEERQLLVRGRVVLSFYDATAKLYAHGVAFTQYSAQDGTEIARYVASASSEPPRKP
ncbi:MAG: PilZ domain-containing protein [Candidatus Baltobacteraceae bacterium]